MTRIVDSILVDEDCADQSTELDQRVPVPAVAGETRSLDREHGANTASADRPDQTIEPGRATLPPERPRSSSTISTVAQPS